MSTNSIPTDPEHSDVNGNTSQLDDDQAVRPVKMADPIFMERFFGPQRENEPFVCTLKAWTKVRELGEAFIRGETRPISETPLPGVNEHLWNRLLEMRPDAGRVTAAGPAESSVTRSLRLRNQPRMSYETNAMYDSSMAKQAIEQQKADAQKCRRGQWRSNTPQVRSGSVARKTPTATARFERATTVQPASARPTLVDMEPSSSTVWKKPALPIRSPPPRAPFVFPNMEIARSTPGSSPITSPVAPVVPAKPRRGRPPNALRFNGPSPRPPPPKPVVKADITPPKAAVAVADPPKRRGRPPKIHRENTFNSVLSIAQAAQQQVEVQPEVEVEVIEQRDPSPEPLQQPVPLKATTRGRRRSTHQSPATVPATINPNPYQQPFTASGGGNKRANTRAPSGTPANKQLRFHEPTSSDSSSSIEVLRSSGPSPRRPITQTTNSVMSRSTPNVQNGIPTTTAIPLPALPSLANGQSFAFPNGTIINSGQVLVGGGPGLQGMVPVTMDAAVAIQMHPQAVGGQVIPVLPVVKSGTGQYVDITFFQDKVRELQNTMTSMQNTMNVLQNENRALAGVQNENRILIESLRNSINNLAVSNGTSTATNNRSSASNGTRRANVKQEPRD